LNTVLKVVLLCGFFTAIIVLQVHLDAVSTTSRTLKEVAEFATHDASLAVVEEQVVDNGLVEFVPAIAEERLKDSLKYHLRLKDSLSPYVLEPLSNSFLDSPIEIKYIRYFDDTNTTFPYIYEDLAEGIVQPLYGPSVVALIEAQSPTPFVGTRKTIQRLAVYEYKK
jgi:hypothetical protein